MRQSEWPRVSKKPRRLGSNGGRLVVAALLLAIPLLLWLMVSLRPPRPPPQSIKGTAVDMHVHSTESDGDRTAEEQIKFAASTGVKTIWFADHDLIRDLSRTKVIQAAGRSSGVEVGFAVEITVDWEGKEHHLLGYFPDLVWEAPELSPAMKKLQTEVALVKESRENRNQQLVAYLNQLLQSESGRSYFTSTEKATSFKPLAVSAVAQWAMTNANLMEPTSLGRPHFRAYLIENGVDERLIFGPRAGDGVALLASDNQVYFDEARTGQKGVELEALLHSATLAKRNIAFKPLPIVDAIGLINAAGGRAVLAHPPTLGSDWAAKFANKVADLAAAGLWGIEAFSSEIDAENHAIIRDLATKNGLIMTGGSDNHGTLKIYAQLGVMHRAGQQVYADLEYWAREGLRQSTALKEDL